MPDGPTGLKPGHVVSLFPFFPECTGSGETVAAGPSRRKFLPSFNTSSRFLDHFRLQSPAEDFAELKPGHLTGKTVVIAEASGSFQLRGQIVALENGHWVFLGSPAGSRP